MSVSLAALLFLMLTSKNVQKKLMPVGKIIFSYIAIRHLASSLFLLENIGLYNAI